MRETLPVNGYRSARERLAHDWPPSTRMVPEHRRRKLGAPFAGRPSLARGGARSGEKARYIVYIKKRGRVCLADRSEAAGGGRQAVPARPGQSNAPESGLAHAGVRRRACGRKEGQHRFSTLQSVFRMSSRETPLCLATASRMPLNVPTLSGSCWGIVLRGGPGSSVCKMRWLPRWWIR